MTLVLAGERVVLRSLRPDDLEPFWRGRGGRLTRERCLERIARSGELVDGRLDLAIDVDDRLVGDIGGRLPEHAFPPGVIEVGIDLFDPRDRGNGYGSEAIRLFTSHLFESGLAERVQGSTAVGNAAMRRVFERLGFAYEGIMRGFMPVEDGREDYALYAVLRGEWTA